MSDTTITGWMMTAQGKPLEKRSFPAPALAAGDAMVEVAGCGLCHTDISFLHMGVKTRMELPLVLGHEVSGIVKAVGEGGPKHLVGKPVVVPAVLPCGTCELCRSGNRNICRSQIMPGNDRHGGFATHMVVPGKYICPVPEKALAKNELWQLSVVADAVSTPFMAVRRANVKDGDVAIVIGSGGIGIYAVQAAAASGAKVVAIDVDPAKLEMAKSFGAKAAVDVKGMGEKDVKAAVGAEVKKLGGASACWKIFETSGTKPGQTTAFSLLNHGGYIAIVGFTMDKLELRVSNLMAFDATMRGNWGCDPELYPEILEWVGSGRLQVAPLVEKRPLDGINEAIEAAHHGQLKKRAVLVP